MSHATFISLEGMMEKTKNVGTVVNRKCCTCGKLNHFACICRTNPTKLAKHVTHQDPCEEAEYVYTVGRDKQPMCKVMIDRKEVDILVDSGAPVDLIDEKTFRELFAFITQQPSCIDLIYF